jgi:hypothetical protein
LRAQTHYSALEKFGKRPHLEFELLSLFPDQFVLVGGEAIKEMVYDVGLKERQIGVRNLSKAYMDIGGVGGGVRKKAWEDSPSNSWHIHT